MLKKSVLTMAAALFVISAHAADPAQPAPAAKPEAAASANDAAAQDPVEAALSAVGGAPAPAEKPAAGADAPPAASAPAQGLAVGVNGGAKGAVMPAEKPAAGADTPASTAAADARPQPTRPPVGERKRQPRSEESGGRYAKHGEGKRPAMEGEGAKPGATQQIDWQARRAERQVKRAAKSNHGMDRYQNPHKKQAAPEAAD